MFKFAGRCLVLGYLFGKCCVIQIRCSETVEVMDFIEHGSDHSPIYLRVKVYPAWIKCPPSKRRILKKSGIESLEKTEGKVFVWP